MFSYTFLHTLMHLIWVKCFFVVINDLCSGQGKGKSRGRGIGIGKSEWSEKGEETGKGKCERKK